MASALTLPLRKLVVELRYEPELAFYGKMDAVGTNLSVSYPDWQRSALSLEIRDKKRRRRVFLAHNRCFYEMDGPDPVTDFRSAADDLKKICDQLAVQKLLRIGIRQWFAADLKKPFALMLDDIDKRFLARHASMSAALSDKLCDLGYDMVYETGDGWKYHLRLGPMVKKEWFELISHEPAIFEDGDDEGTHTFEKFEATIPEQFVLIDIDSYRVECSTQEMTPFFDQVRRKTHDVTTKLIELLKG